jgi:hypothetical protein
MNLPEDIAVRVVAATAKLLADRVDDDLDEMLLVPFKVAAKILGVSEPKARSLIREYVDLGESSRRVRVSVLKTIIASRTIYPSKP